MASVRATATVLVFFVIYLMAPNTSDAYRACCSRYYKYKLPFNAIKGYSVSETSMCQINAIIFHTRKGKLVCANPNLSWVIDYVNRLKSKAQKIHLKTPKRERAAH